MNPKLQPVETPLPAIVNELASVQTQIAFLEAREKELKRALIETGLHEVCGTHIRAVITVVPATLAIDYRAAAEAAYTVEHLKSQYSKPKAGYTTVKLYGYN